MSTKMTTMDMCLKIFKNSNVTSIDYMYLIIASIVSACGFMIDSETVIIGTMLISPLLKPVVLTALDLITPNQNNILNHMTHLIIMICITLLSGFIVGKINIHKEEEIVENATFKSRVHGLNDSKYVVVIGILCGVALALSTFYDNGKFSSLIAGAGISTSILPPLIVGGINFAFKNYTDGKNSILLSLMNFATIFISFLITKSGLC